MKTVTVQTSDIEQATCANEMIRNLLPQLLTAHGAPEETKAALARALAEFGAGLERMLPPSPVFFEVAVELEVLATARESHAEIWTAVELACELANVPRELAEQVTHILREFDVGLQRLIGTAESSEPPRPEAA